MNVGGTPKIVLLGMMSKMPVAGVVWQTLHYLVGFRSLGYDVYYVEAHARTPSALMEHEHEDSSAKAAAFIAEVMRQYDFGDRWAFHALHADGRCYGLSHTELNALYGSAAMIINLHGGTMPLPEHCATGRLVYLETDPVALQIELYDRLQTTVDFLEPHCAFFTFGENYGQPDCGLPVDPQFTFLPTRQPVVLDFWKCNGTPRDAAFSTIGNWQQQWREVVFRGETYYWSKHHEFLKFLDVPARTARAFELALSGYTDADRKMLQEKGWRVTHALSFSNDMTAYRAFIANSQGEFTVAKDQNIRLRSGWFSDRSATYLAAGRPVITQDTGFGRVLPTGEGLFAFSTMEDVCSAVAEIDGDYQRHSRAAREIAREYFDAEKVLSSLVRETGLA